jgi:hypothetical protein
VKHVIGTEKLPAPVAVDAANFSPIDDMAPPGFGNVSDASGMEKDCVDGPLVAVVLALLEFVLSKGWVSIALGVRLSPLD